jgi:hypothetical protein
MTRFNPGFRNWLTGAHIALAEYDATADASFTVATELFILGLRSDVARTNAAANDISVRLEQMAADQQRFDAS